MEKLVSGPKISKCARYDPKCEKADFCIEGGGDIYKLIKSFRKSKTVVATSMDGVKDDVKHCSKGIFENFSTQQMMLKTAECSRRS